MEDFHDLFNCSMQKHYESNGLVNVTALTREELESGAGFNTITGVILLFFINVIVNNEHKKLTHLYRTRSCNEKLLWRTIILIILVFVSPVIVVGLALGLVYKLMCYILLKLEDKNFVKFLDSFDVFWSLEDDVTKCIINVLGIIECDNPQKIVENIQEKLLKMSEINGTSKIFYRRIEKYGFYYWRKPDTVDITEYVQLFDITNVCGHLDEKGLEQIMSNISDRVLPFDGEGTFKILVTKQKIAQNNETRSTHALICKIHHSVGDGVALIQFLCQALADEMKNTNINRNFLKMSANYENSSNKSASDLFDILKALYHILVCISNKILKEPDNNSIHGPKLSGESIFNWIDEDETLYPMVKAIKNSVEGLHFSDVILAALAHSLKNYYMKMMTRIPEYTAVIIPVRLTEPSLDLKLESNFSLTLLDLPNNGNLEVVSKCNELLRQSSEALANNSIVKVCSMLPKQFLEPLLDSRHASIIFSNIIGPSEISICGGNTLKSLVFFPPSKGTTGLVLSSLYYGGVLRLAVRADLALISDPKGLGIILDGMVVEIKRLYKQYAKN